MDLKNLGIICFLFINLLVTCLGWSLGDPFDINSSKNVETDLASWLSGLFKVSPSSSHTTAVTERGRPPHITAAMGTTQYYVPGQEIQFNCQATGSPPPTYTWRKNGETVIVGDSETQAEELVINGTLLLAADTVDEETEGLYQCVAENDHGRSLSNFIDLKMAVLENALAQPDRTLEPKIGSPLTLPCNPPRSVPDGSVTWVLLYPPDDLEPVEDSVYNKVQLSDRVTVDYEYNLHFTNVQSSDIQDGGGYTCVTFNSHLRAMVVGPQTFLMPKPGSFRYRLMPPLVMWSSPSDIVALLGSELKMKCIFSGIPTPRVHWMKRGSWTLPEHARLESVSQELVLADVKRSDAGEYRCMASSFMPTGIMSEYRTFHVTVESPPQWVEDLQSVEVGEGQTAEVMCLATGIPEPSISWFVNGIELSEVVASDERFQPSSFTNTTDRLVFHNVTTDYLMVIQCNASNKHGYLWADITLNVMAIEEEENETTTSTQTTTANEYSTTTTATPTNNETTTINNQTSTAENEGNTTTSSQTTSETGEYQNTTTTATTPETTNITDEYGNTTILTTTQATNATDRYENTTITTTQATNATDRYENTTITTTQDTNATDKYENTTITTTQATNATDGYENTTITTTQATNATDRYENTTIPTTEATNATDEYGNTTTGTQTTTATEGNQTATTDIYQTTTTSTITTQTTIAEDNGTSTTTPYATTTQTANVTEYNETTITDEHQTYTAFTTTTTAETSTSTFTEPISSTQSTIDGVTVNLTCSSNSDLHLSVTLFKDMEVISLTNDRFAMQLSGDFPMKNMKRHEEGIYTCHVTNITRDTMPIIVVILPIVSSDGAQSPPLHMFSFSLCVMSVLCAICCLCKGIP